MKVSTWKWLTRSIAAGGIVLVLQGGWTSAAPLPDPDAVVSRAMTDFREKRYQDVSSALESNLKEHPEHAASHHLMGLVLSMQGKNEAALLHLEKALELSPHHPAYAVNFAKFCLQKGAVKRAEQLLEQTVKISPSPSAFELLALIRLDQNQGKEVVRLLEESLKLDGDAASSWYYLGLAHHSLGQLDPAIVCYRETLKRTPKDLGGHLQLGKVYVLRGNWAEALRHLSIAKEGQPAASEVHRYLSQVHLACGDLQSALSSARRAVELNPRDFGSHYQLGQVLARLGKADEADKEFRWLQENPASEDPSPLARWRQLFDQPRNSSHATP